MGSIKMMEIQPENIEESVKAMREGNIPEEIIVDALAHVVKMQHEIIVDVIEVEGEEEEQEEETPCGCLHCQGPEAEPTEVKPDVNTMPMQMKRDIASLALENLLNDLKSKLELDFPNSRVFKVMGLESVMIK